MSTPARKTTLHVATPDTSKVRKPSTPRPSKADQTAAAARQALRNKVAGVVGGIGVAVIALSVIHVADAVSALTGSHWALSGLLAIGIDAGMVACELAELIAHGDINVRRWASRYMVLSIALSMLLNAYAFASHAHSTTELAAGIILGVVIPALVFILGRVAGYLANPA
jgi:hypothetical protein